MKKLQLCCLRKKIGFNVLSEARRIYKVSIFAKHFSGLPVITGKGAENAAAQANAIFKAIYGKLDQVRGLVFVGQRRWNLIMASGQVVMLPEKNPEQAIQKNNNFR